MEEAKKRVGAGCGVMLLRDGKALFGKRHTDPKKADSELHGEGTWTFPGGKFDAGDALLDGPCREVKEETGIDIDRSSLEIISVSSDHLGDIHFITVGFLARKWSGEPRVMEPDEITDWQWFPLNQLPTPLFFPTERMIKNYVSKRLFNE